MGYKETWANMSPASKRKTVMVAAVVVMICVAWLLVKLSEGSGPKRTGKQRPIQHELLTVRDPQSLGLDGLKADIEQMRKQIREMAAGQRTRPADNGYPAYAGGMPPSAGTSTDLSPEDRTALERIQNAPSAPTGNAPLPAPGQAQPQPPRLVSSSDQIVEDVASAADMESDGLEIVSFGEDASKKTNADGSPKLAKKDTKKQNNARFVLPAGSLMEGVLITGLDAPTANQARQQPFPALVRIKHEAMLPNRWRADIRECFLVASAYGDLASERAYLRAEAISCVRDDGRIMEAALDAFATGEDGKNGVRGRIVSKQGSMIAQSLMGGFIQGVANIYQPARIPQLTLNSGGSSYGRPNPSMAVQEGIAGGIQSAGKAVADFYIDMARNTFPIIEVDAGRKVTFVVSRSVSVSAKSDSDIGSTVRDGAAALGGAVNRVTGG